jgi:NAD-dependent dihydropyrimidine dehydrogenase PreA subunit
MSKRKIVLIDQSKCNGCGECIPNCKEGAIQIIDGKARLISDYFCDGLGACLGHCPMDAIKIEEREAEDYNESKVMDKIAQQGENTIKAHLQHLKEHNEVKLLQEAIIYLNQHNLSVPETEMDKPLPCGCPGSAMVSFEREDNRKENVNVNVSSELTQWPVQLHLVPVNAPFLNNSHLLIAADCTAYALGNFHNEFLQRKKLLIACPKLDDTVMYKQKLVEMFKNNNFKSITVLIMEVPCSSGLYRLVQESINESGKQIPLIKEVISMRGDIL